MLPKKLGEVACLWRTFRKFGKISQYHPETYDRFYSYPAVLAERQRHLYEGGSFIIHPFSLSSLSWTSIMILINTAHMCCSTFRLSFIIMDIPDIKPQYVDGIMLALNFFCWIDILVKFNTGYVVGNMTNIVLDRTMISWHYLIRWFHVDFLSSMPVALIILYWFPSKTRHLLVALIMPLLRCSRIYTVVMDLKILMKTFTKSYIWHGCVCHAFCFLVTCHWCSCVIYLPPVMALYWYREVPLTYTSFLVDGLSPSDIRNFSIGTRYKKSFFIAISAFFGTGFSMFSAREHDEILVHSLVILYAAMFMVYNFVFLLKMYMTMYSSTVRYHEMINQVEEYMRHKQFPLPLKKRVRAFYYYQYQEKYFNEENVLNSLSEGLRNEITLHTCSKLVEKVALFQGAPPNVMGSILGCLRPEVYLPNESVMRAGELGNCMFFVANGTVAVYSLKGAEVCHLEDGAHFGEVALLMKDSKRVATVIAVEITLLYRLDSEDFKQYITTDEMLYERVEALASKRMHETVILDEELSRHRGQEPYGKNQVVDALSKRQSVSQRHTTSRRHSNSSPRHSNSSPRHSNSSPRHSNSSPRYSNISPRHSNISPRHSNSSPRHSNITPRHSNVSPQRSAATRHSVSQRDSVSNFPMGTTKKMQGPGFP